jgi:hypothetical protein
MKIGPHKPRYRYETHSNRVLFHILCEPVGLSQVLCRKIPRFVSQRAPLPLLSRVDIQGYMSTYGFCSRTENLGFWTQTVGFLNREGEINLLLF